MAMQLKIINLKIWLALLVFVIAICAISSARASTATWGGTHTFSFAGDSCAAMTAAWADDYMAAQGVTGLSGSNCASPITAGANVYFDFAFTSGSTGQFNVLINTVDSTGSTTAPVMWNNTPLLLQALFIGICALAFCYGIFTGQQR